MSEKTSVRKINLRGNATNKDFTSKIGKMLGIILPLEVERTRGLSLQGNTGLPSAIGYGRPGDSAHVWMLIENIGNAQETTQMQWSSNTWDAETKLIDYNGVEQWNVELLPSSTKEFLIDFEVPGSTTLGESSSTTLSTRTRR